MAEKTDTYNVNSWESFIVALQKAPSTSTALKKINITADLTFPDHLKPEEGTDYIYKPVYNYALEGGLVVDGQNHEIKNVKVYDVNINKIFQTHTTSSRYGSLKVNNLKILNCYCPNTRFTLPYTPECSNLTITGVWYTGVPANGSVYVDFISNSNLVQMLAQNVSPAQLFGYNCYNTHTYIIITRKFDVPIWISNQVRSFLEIDDKFANTLDFQPNPGDTAWRNNAVVLKSDASFNIPSRLTPDDTISIFNKTTAPNVHSLSDKIKMITDEQMKNADYLNSIGFTVTPTN